MGVTDFIANKPAIVVIAWILVAVVALPLFAKLSTVVQEQQYTLPENSEAMTASRLIEKVRGGSGSVGVIVVTGVDLRDNNTALKLAIWGNVFNETVAGHYMSDIKALPVMLAEANATLYHAMLTAVTNSTAYVKQLYQAFNEVDKAYASALENATRQVEVLNQSIEGIMEADKGYAEAYHGLLQLAETLNTTINGLIELDNVLVNTTEELLGLAQQLNETATGLQKLDSVYSRLYQGLTANAPSLVAVLSNKTLVERMEEGLAFTWWQVSRAYYYLEAYNGSYEAYSEVANLTAVDPKLAPLQPAEALKAWRAVKQLVAEGLDPDTAAARVAASIIASQTPPELRQLLPVFTNAWLEALARAKTAMKVTVLTEQYRLPPASDESQLAVLDVATKAAETATDSIVVNSMAIAAQLLAEQLVSQGIPRDAAELLAEKAVRGTLEPIHVATVVAGQAVEEIGLPAHAKQLLAEILVASDPRAEGVLASSRADALNAAEKLLEALGVPREALDAARRILDQEMNRKAAAEEAAKLIERQLDERAKMLLAIVLRLDPDAHGLLAQNPEEAAEAVAEIVYNAMEEQGAARLPREVVSQLALLVARGGASPEQLRSLALSLVEQQVAGKMGQEQARLLAEALQRFDPDAAGRLADDPDLALQTVFWMAEQQGRRLPFTPEQLREILGSKGALRRLVAEALREKVLENTPAEAKPYMERIIEVVISEGPGVPEARKWNVIEDLLREAVREKASLMSINGLELPGWLPGRIAELAVAAARGELTVEEAAEKLAEQLLLGTVYPKMLSESKGLLVSSDYQAFLVMGTPLGVDRDELAKNTVEAGKVAEELLERLGIGYEKVYTSGSALLMKQVEEYASKDVEKTSKFSELGTFIVLLLILESIFAVLLPYIGVFLGLAVGGALVYLAASNGWIDVTSTSHSLMITTALGLGADYAGYIVHRFREEYAVLHDPREASRRALKRAGPAVVASALTVIIGFGSLLLGWDIGFLRSIGETIPLTVAVTALASLTLVPALLSMLGGWSWFWWPRKPSPEKHVGRESKVVKALIRYELLVLAVILAAIAGSAYFYVTFKGSHDMKLMLPDNAPALKAFEVLKEKFTPGVTDPVYVAAVFPQSIWSSNVTAEALDGLAARIAEVPGVARVMAPTRPMGEKVGIEEAKQMGGEKLASRDGRVAVIQVILDVDPYSRKGEETVKTIHGIVHSYAEQHGFKAYVGGVPYAVLEMDQLLHDRYYHRILPAASLLMVMVFTSIFGSLVASIAALLVIIGAAMMGITASVILFQDILGKPVLWFLHIVSMIAVLGVGMDYNSFFLARALEEFHRSGGDSKKAVVRAAGAVSTFVVGLALVVTSAYLALMTASNIGMREMGFTLAVTVLLAGLMAAYLLTPLIVSLLGRRAWWPWGLRKRIEH